MSTFYCVLCSHQPINGPSRCSWIFNIRFFLFAGYSDGYVARRGSAFEPGVQTPNTNIHSQLSYKVDLFVLVACCRYKSLPPGEDLRPFFCGKKWRFWKIFKMVCQTKPVCQLNVGKNFNLYWYKSMPCSLAHTKFAGVQHKPN